MAVLNEIEITTLSNGTKIISENLPHLNSFSLGFWFNVGTRDENNSNNGISHFIEHMLFKGTKRRSAKRISEEIAGGEKVWWMTPGWINFRHHVFKDWDKGMANENFPRHTGGAIVLDGIGFVESYMAAKPEEFLEYSDWMGIPIQPYPIALDRLKSLLLGAAHKLDGNEKK